MPQIKITYTRDELIDMLTDVIETGAIRSWANFHARVKISRQAADDRVTAVSIFTMPGDETAPTAVIEWRALLPEDLQTGADRIMSGAVEVGEDARRALSAGDVDAVTLDCVVQAALFGAIIFD